MKKIPLAILASIIIIIGLLYSRTIMHEKKKDTPTTPASPNTQLAELLIQGERAYKKGDTKEALHSYVKGLHADPSLLKTLSNAGIAMAASNNYQKALPFFQVITTVQPKNIAALIQTGMCLYRLKKYDEAETYFAQALKYAPNSFDAHLQISKNLIAQNQYDKALLHAKKATTVKPNSFIALMNLGYVYNERGELDNAIENYKKALALEQSSVSAIYNIGYSLRLAGKMKEAIPYLEKALSLKEDHIDALIGLSHAHWSLGHFDKAWQLYEKRWLRFPSDPRPTGIPAWDGTTSLQGKNILLYAEQGMGDTLQFIRFAKNIKQRGAFITCKIQRPLVTLLASYPYVDSFVTEMPHGDMLKKFDYHAPIMSLPGLLKITPETIPADTPYLSVDAHLVNQWQKKIAHDTKFKVGLRWHVDPIHERDKSPLSKRSIPVNLFAKLNNPTTSFYSLQKINGTELLKHLPKDFTLELATFDPHFDETHGRFMDTAALIKNLDLVITVDTSIAHLAAALGKETWVLLPYAPDCRFSLQRTDMPWYPTMRLFRQNKPFEWEHVITAINNELHTKLTAKNRTAQKKSSPQKIATA